MHSIISSTDGIFSFFVRNKGRKFLICLTPKLYSGQNLAMRKSVSTILTQDIHTREFNKLKATFLGSILQRGVRTNFFFCFGGGVLSKFLLDNSSFSAPCLLIIIAQSLMYSFDLLKP